ncbi:Rha family transcriptional regulator, partial [Enterococcus faecalis]
MDNLVIMKNQQAVTTSLQVAEVFEKQHKHVIEAIEAKIQSAENSAYYQNMFAEGEYKDSRGRKQRLYYMNRDGFSFIAFGFTGKKADSFKLKYIEAFNQMEELLKTQSNLP